MRIYLDSIGISYAQNENTRAAKQLSVNTEFSVDNSCALSVLTLSRECHMRG